MSGQRVSASNHRDYCNGCRSCRCMFCRQPITDLLVGCRKAGCRAGEEFRMPGLETTLDRAWNALNLTEDWIFLDARQIVARELDTSPNFDEVLQDRRVKGLIDAWDHCYKLLNHLDGNARKQLGLPRKFRGH